MVKSLASQAKVKSSNLFEDTIYGSLGKRLSRRPFKAETQGSIPAGATIEALTRILISKLPLASNRYVACGERLTKYKKAK